MCLLRVAVVGGDQVGTEGHPGRWDCLRLFGGLGAVSRPLTLGGGRHGSQRSDDDPGQSYLREQTRCRGKGGSFHTPYYGAPLAAVNRWKGQTIFPIQPALGSVECADVHTR